MRSQLKKFPYLLLIIADSSVFMLCSAWIAHILNRNQITSGDVGNIPTPDELLTIKIGFEKFRVINEVNS